VSSACRLPLLALFAVLLGAVPALSAPKPETRATPEQIARWIKELGADDFASREAASKHLWAAGAAAESALEAAGKSDDAEVSRRAREILDKFRWGIYPDTPQKIVDLVTSYQSAEPGAKREIIRQLLQGGRPGCQAVLKIATAEPDAEVRSSVFAQIVAELPQAIPQALADNSFDRLEAILELGLTSDKAGLDDSRPLTHYTAYWLLRGKLDERIARLRSLADRDPANKRYPEVLAYLYRAKGDLASARTVAEKAGRPRLVTDLLYEVGDWKELARRPAVPEPAGRFRPTDEIEQLGFRAAFHRLAGNAKDCEAALAELSKNVKAGQADNGPTDRFFLAAKAFFLNDRPGDGLEFLAQSERRTALFEVLLAQHKYAEALDLAKKVPAEKKEGQLPAVELLQARTLYLLGETDRARAIFTRYADLVKEGQPPPPWYDNLLDAEYRAGLKDEAFAHCAKVLALVPGKDVAFRTHPRSYLARVFPDKTDTADVWWEVLGEEFAGEGTAVRLKRLRDLMAGKTAGRDVKALIERVEERLKGKPAQEIARRLQACAEVALAARLDDVARSCLEKAAGLEGGEQGATAAQAALLRLGDLLADRKQWERAAERYRQAWEKDRHEPLPLYLAGWALKKAGQEKEGARLLEQSHWLPLGSEPTRFEFIRALSQRGQSAAAQREAELLGRTCEPGGFYVGPALRLAALGALARKDYFTSARLYEQFTLLCLRSGLNFIQAGNYVSVPALVHRLRAQGLLAAGKVEEALREADLTRTAMPADIELAITLLPELERRGHKKEADRLFADSLAVWEKLCQAYPRCSYAHNSAAWLSACCRRNLDDALAHARKAVELAPDNAGHLDTLAEVYFQRGEKDKAVAAQKRVVEMDPKKAYFRKQLERLEAGDPSAPRPTEDD
jgi:tetratricopeptide (TPR) repeat protein